MNVLPPLAKIPVTEEFLQTFRHTHNGWTKKQLGALGIAWPPKKGWKKLVLGKMITVEEAQVFMGDSERARGALAEDDEKNEFPAFRTKRVTGPIEI